MTCIRRASHSTRTCIRRASHATRTYVLVAARRDSSKDPGRCALSACRAQTRAARAMRITTAMALRRSRTPRRNMIRFYLIPSSVIHPSEEGWGRQNVETDLVNIWTGVVRDAISVRTLRCILSNLVSTFCLPQPLPKRVGVDKPWIPFWLIFGPT